MEIFLNEFFGVVDYHIYYAWFLWALIGAVGVILVRAFLKYEKSPETPNKWSWKFLFIDNIPNLLIGFFVTFISLRFCEDLLHMEPSSFTAFMIGVTNNEVTLKLLKFSGGARNKV